MELDFIPIDYDCFDFQGRNYARITGRTFSGKRVCAIDSCDVYFWAILQEKISDKQAKSLIEQIQKITPSLSGNELITLLQYPSPQTTKNLNQLYGVRIGQIQKLLVEALIAQNIENTKDAATQFVLNLPKEILYP